MGLRIGHSGTIAVAALEGGKANVIDGETVSAIAGALADVGDDGALVLTGRPGMFSGGLDLSVVEAGDHAAQALMSAMGHLLGAVLRSPRPVVIAADGHGIAAGAMLMLVADRTVVSDRPASYGFAEVPNGLPLPAGVVELVAAKAAPTATLRLAAHGELVDGAEAVRVGLADEQVPADRVVDVAIERAAALAALPAGPYAETKLLVNGPLADRMAKRSG